MTDVPIAVHRVAVIAAALSLKRRNRLQDGNILLSQLVQGLVGAYLKSTCCCPKPIRASTVVTLNRA